jgi:hypothetical protein
MGTQMKTMSSPLQMAKGWIGRCEGIRTDVARYRTRVPLKSLRSSIWTSLLSANLTNKAWGIKLEIKAILIIMMPERAVSQSSP